MEMAEINESNLPKLMEECSNMLKLQKFYTAGPSEVSSWLIKKGASAP